MKKLASKVAEPAKIQPKSQFLFHKNLPPRDFSIMTLKATRKVRRNPAIQLKLEHNIILKSHDAMPHAKMSISRLAILVHLWNET